MSVLNNDIVRITARMIWGGAENAVQNVYHVQYVGATVSDDDFKVAVAAKIDTAYGDIVSHLPNELTFVDMVFFDLTGGYPLGQRAWPVRTAGTGGSGSALPPQLSAMLLFNSNIPRSQGRKFLPPFIEADATTFGGIGATALTAMGTMGARFLGSFAISAGVGLFGNARLVGGTTWGLSTWVGCQVRINYMTQRRRRAGVGM